MNQLPKKDQNSSQKNIILIVGILMGVGIVVLATLVFLLLRQNGFQFSLPAVQTQATPTLPATMVSPEPTLVNPSQLDLLFLKSSVSAEQSTVTLDIRLTNKGVNPITLTNDDLSVTPEGGTASPPSDVTPALPQNIAPGASVTLSVTFPYPNAPLVVLNILDLTVNYSFQ